MSKKYYKMNKLDIELSKLLVNYCSKNKSTITTLGLDLIRNGANPNIESNDGYLKRVTILHPIVDEDNVDVLRVAFEMGCRPNEETIDRTMGNWSWKCAEFFIDKGFMDVNYRNKNGLTYLMKTSAGKYLGDCTKKQLELVKLLIVKGSDITARDTIPHWGKNALEWAMHHNSDINVGNNDLIKYLQENMPKPVEHIKKDINEQKLVHTVNTFISTAHWNVRKSAFEIECHLSQPVYEISVESLENDTEFRVNFQDSHTLGASSVNGVMKFAGNIVQDPFVKLVNGWLKDEPLYNELPYNAIDMSRIAGNVYLVLTRPDKYSSPITTETKSYKVNVKGYNVTNGEFMKYQ